MSTKPTIGFVGTGKMGYPMVSNMLAAGFPVIAFNRSIKSLATVETLGARRATSLAQIAQSADIVMTSLTNQQSVRDVYLGDAGFIAFARPSQIFVDTSTNDVPLMREIATELGSRGASFLDAPVSGGVAGAESSTLTVMVGGDEQAFKDVLSLLEIIGDHVYHLGPVGAGTAVKLVNQLLVGINMAAVAEALIFGASAGADPQKILDVISSSFGGSRMLDRGVPLIQERNFAPATPIDLIRKDLGIVLEAAATGELPLHLTKTALDLFDRTSEEGYGDNDMTAVVISLENDARIKVS